MSSTTRRTRRCGSPRRPGRTGGGEKVGEERERESGRELRRVFFQKKKKLNKN
jgi:hypothetical protein